MVKKRRRQRKKIRNRPPLPRAQSADRRAGQARQSRQGTVVFPRHLRLRAVAPRSAPTARRAEATGDGRPLPVHLKTQIRRELDRLELLLDQTVKEAGDRARRAARRATARRASAGGEDVARIQGHRRWRWPPSFGWRRYFATLTIAASTRLTLGWRPRPGKAAQSDPRAGCFQGRESAIANQPNPACLALAAPSAAIGADSVVQRTGQRQRWSFQEVDHRRARARAAGGVMEICHRRHRHRRAVMKDA